MQGHTQSLERISRARRSVASPDAVGGHAPVAVVFRTSVFGGDRRRREVFVGPCGAPLSWVLQKAWDVDELAGVCVVINGRPVDAGQDVRCRCGDVVLVAPRPGLDPVDWVLIGITLVSSLASVYLMSQLRAAAIGSQTPEEQRYGFGRFSNDAFAGEEKPVVLGTKVRYGGKVIARVPYDAPDGSGNDKVGILVYLSNCTVAKIGDQSDHFDDLDIQGLTGFFVQDQPGENFTGFKVSGRMGTADQRPIRGFEDTTLVQEVGAGGVVLRNTDGADRTDPAPSGEAFNVTTINAVHAFQVRVRFAQGLYRVDEQVQVEPVAVQYRIAWRPVAGSWSAWSLYTVRQGRQSPFWSSPRIEVSDVAQQVEVRVERVTKEVSDLTLKDEMTWDSLVNITDSANAYPGQALVAFEIEAGQQVQDLPRLSVNIDGCAQCRVWDGVSPVSAPEFVEGFTRNPLYLALTLATNSSWGMGETDDGQDFETLLAEAAYADELVPILDGSGNPTGQTRKRYECNLVLGSEKEAADWMRTICATARVKPVQAGVIWRYIGDRPRTLPVETYTDGSVAADENGPMIVLRREGWKNGVLRPTQIVLQYEDEENSGLPDTIVFPQVGQLWLGGAEAEPVVSVTERVDGITNRYQAYAEAVYRMKVKRLRTRAIRFVPTLHYPSAQPGDRFDFAGTLALHGHASGRVMSGSTDERVRLDRTVVIESGRSYQLRVVHLDNSEEVREISLPAGEYVRGTEISLAAALTQDPSGGEYVLESLDGGEVVVGAKPWLCTAVVPTESDPLRWSVEGVEYVESVYSTDPRDLTVRPYSGLQSPLTPPGPLLTLSVFERRDPVTGQPQAVLAWSQRPADRANTLTFRAYRRSIGTVTWSAVPSSLIEPGVAVSNLVSLSRGYEFVVVAVSAGGSALSPYHPGHPIARLALGLSDDPLPPPDDLGLDQVLGNVYNLTWTAVEGAAGYIVYSGGWPAGDVFDNCRDGFVLARVEDNFLNGLHLPDGEVAFYVRTVSANGRMSKTVSTITIDNTDAPDTMAVKSSHTCDLAGTGTPTNVGTVSGDSVPDDPVSPAVWESPEYDTGVDTLTQLTYNLRSANRAEDHALEDSPLIVPSIEADQWGVDDEGPPRHVGMIFPPFPDSGHQWKVEVRTKSGGVWGAWGVLAPYALLERTFRQFQVKVTWQRGAFPYRPGVRELAFGAFD